MLLVSDNQLVGPPKGSRLSARHPLQSADSPSRGFSAVLHIIGLASFANSFHFLIANPNSVNDSYGWHFQYLTIIGLMLATLTFTAGALADVMLSPRLFRIKNVLSMCSAPLECLISGLYWGLRAVDPKLVVPEELELDFLPDIGFHIIPSALLVLDILFLSPPWTITPVPAIGLSAAIAFAYWFWIELCYQNNGWYPYPLFAMLDATQRIGLFSASALLMAVVTAVLKWLYYCVNGNVPRASATVV